jgi:hypothetical protein
MNLHQMVAGAIGMVNPFITVEILRSAGYTTNPDGSRTPTYVTLSGPAQVQDMSTDELRLLSDAGINIQGIHKAIYLNGGWAGIVRADQQGGDVFRFSGYDWLVTVVPEQWPDWTKVMVTMQATKPESPFTTPPPAVAFNRSQR